MESIRQLNKVSYKVKMLKNYENEGVRVVIWVRPAESFKGTIHKIEEGFLILKDSSGFKITIDIDDICVIEEA